MGPVDRRDRSADLSASAANMCSMRWQNLKRGDRTQGSLPGVGEPVIRTFDAPEALGMRFYEVEARSALNSVPKRSRMPFRWTINPFRGCTHACVKRILLRPSHA